MVVLSTLLKQVSGHMLLVWRSVRVKHAMHGGSRDAMGLGDLSQAHSVLAIALDRFAVELERLAPDLPAFETGPPHAGADPLGDQVPFQLGDRADDDDEGAAHRATGVDLFSAADEFDT